MAYYLVYPDGGNTYAPTLGNLLSSSLRIEMDNFSISSNFEGYVFFQGSSGARELGLWKFGSSGSYTLILGATQVGGVLILGDVTDAEFVFDVDFLSGDYSFFINGDLQTAGNLQPGTGRDDGAFFRTGARASGGGLDTAAGFTKKGIFKHGNTRVYLNDLLKREYKSSGSGQIWHDVLSSDDAQLQAFPTDDSQWVFYDDGTGTLLAPINLGVTAITPSSVRFTWEQG